MFFVLDFQSGDVMSAAPTLAEVATAAGVSPATVSRALSGSARVKTSTRRRVADAVTRLGYVRQRAAYTLSNRSSAQVVAMAFCEPLPHVLSNPFHSRLLATAEAELSARNLTLILVPSPAGEGARMLPTGAIGGLLLVGASDEHPLVTASRAVGSPVRCIGRPPGSMTVPFVDVDNSDGARQAAEHLLFGGRRRVGVIAGPANVPATADRLSGFTQVIDAAGFDTIPVAYGDFTYASGVHGMRWLLERAPDLDAVFACADTMAAGAAHTLRATGRTVPGDVAMIGFDDAPFARHMTPPLTTVRQPIEELTIQAISALLGDMAHRAPGTLRLLPTELIVRESA